MASSRPRWDDELYTSPAQDLALVREAVAAETPQSVTTALRGVFAGAQPIVFRSARAAPATPAVLETALASAQARPLPDATAQLAVTWPYADFGTPGAIVSRREDAALGATIVTFANGTRLIAKQTDFEKDRVAISVGFGTGQSSVPAALTHANWAASMFPTGGTASSPCRSCAG